MEDLLSRMLMCVVLGTGASIVPTLLAVTNGHAAQPWYCICNGEKKRFLASTRHCEHQMNVAKGSSCTMAQLRKVYGPACAQQGCTIAR